MKIAKLNNKGKSEYFYIEDYWYHVYWQGLKFSIWETVSFIDITGFEIFTDYDLIRFKNYYVWKRRINENNQIRS